MEEDPVEISLPKTRNNAITSIRSQSSIAQADLKSLKQSEDDLSSLDFDEAFDHNFELDDQIQDYYNVTDTFRKNKLPYEDKWLKRAIIYDNQLDKETEGGMLTKETRYPNIEKTLIINPFAEPKEKGKKKKKKE